ncbi:helix-turn-helix domain-containing protein [Actinomyces ruminicola]|uniref:helix-turn-helix domain-containing protein n=1 Tax=Actinomyces ruminicola TaxID=332524 RepID=UPI000B8713C7
MDPLPSARGAAGQRELADRTGVSKQLIAAIESGAHRPSDDTRERLRKALQARPSALLRAAREEVIALADSHGCAVVGVFGSIAGGEGGPATTTGASPEPVRI